MRCGASPEDGIEVHIMNWSMKDSRRLTGYAAAGMWGMARFAWVSLRSLHLFLLDLNGTRDLVRALQLLAETRAACRA